MNPPDTRRIASNRQMPDTPEMLVQRLVHSGGTANWNDIVELSKAYGTPCFHFLRDHHMEREEALDALFEFFYYLRDKNPFPRFEIGLGSRFRSFLFGVLVQWLAERYRHDHALCRAPRDKTLSMSLPSVRDEAERQCAKGSEEERFDRDYFREGARIALDWARGKLVKKGDLKAVEVVDLYLQSPDAKHPDFAEMCRRTDLSLGQVRHILYRFREAAQAIAMRNRQCEGWDGIKADLNGMQAEDPRLASPADDSTELE